MTTLVTGLMLAFCVAAEIARELCFKFALGTPGATSALVALSRSVLWGGIALWAVEVLVWIQVLQRIPLGIAFPIMTLTYVGIPAAGHWVLKERLRPSQWAGAGFVLAGVLLVSLSGA